mgnify:CR=1 FL=1
MRCHSIDSRLLKRLSSPAQLRWNAVPGATGYTLYWSLARGFARRCRRGPGPRRAQALEFIQRQRCGAAFGGIELVMEAYNEAVKEKYRFFSYGDAMFITRNPAPRGPEEQL